jgi:two-component system, NarL family, nitrate/nitrite response regulator NarL
MGTRLEPAVGHLARPGVQIFIISDVRLFREGLSVLLSQNAMLRVVGSAGSDEIAGGIAPACADIALLDAGLADLSGCVRQVREMMDGIKVIAVALGAADRELIACAEAGISAFVGRDASHQDLLHAIDQVRRGETSLSPRQATLLLARVAELAGRDWASSETPNLTRREREIVPLIERGLSNKEIARHLAVEPTTIKNHVHNILEKMQLRRRGEIAARARTLPAWRSHGL